MTTTMDLTSIKGVRVGHAEAETALSGTTVILFDEPRPTACDARGGWPGGYDTESVGSGKAFYRKQAIFLTGGDIFGLAAASGVGRYLMEAHMASLKGGELPAVVGANIYDLDFARGVERVPYESLGYEACRSASSREVVQGNAGGGLGATVGKFLSGRSCSKGGVGSSARAVHSEITVGAICITNAVGNVFDPVTGRTIAGARRNANSAELDFVELTDVIPEYLSRAVSEEPKKATTICVVVTNAKLTHEQTGRLATVAHDGLARVLRPVHAMTDGDTVFAVSTEEVEFGGADENRSLLTLLGELVSQELSKAVLNSVRSAGSLNGVPGLRG
jgi:L-aminopeptidase/D-esterase-like protein